jgi:hypothetical protein
MNWQLVRLLGFTFFGIVTSLGLNFLNYQRYWYKTIYSVQTVDFNILSHSLPTKLSQQLLQGNIEEINRTVNSTYGLFKIVVTDCLKETVDCPNQRILAFSNSYYNFEQPSIKDIQNQPFNTLRNPPPLYPEWEFRSPNDKELTFLEQKNLGKIIGRVYYLRNQPPTFFTDLVRRLKINSPSDLLHVYILTFAFSFSVFCIMSLLLEIALFNHEQRQNAEKKLNTIRCNYLKIIDNKENAIKGYQEKLNKIVIEQTKIKTENDELLHKIQ